MYFWLFLSPLSVWICLVDVKEHRIPNKALLLLGILIEIHLEISKGISILHSHLFALLIFVAGCGVTFILRGAIGMGDVKLLTLLALLKGHLLPTLEILILASFLALIWAVFTRKCSVPFGPSLIAGYFLVLIL